MFRRDGLYLQGRGQRAQRRCRRSLRVARDHRTQRRPGSGLGHLPPQIRPCLPGDPGRAPVAVQHAADRRLSGPMQGPLLAAIGGRLGETLGRRGNLRSAEKLGGGCIHRAFRAADGGHSWFVKVNDASRADLFAAEADGLRALAHTPLRVPQVICHGEAGGDSFLVLEWLTLVAGASRDYAELGRQLARMHALAGSQFGWRRDNYIGSTPQSNAADASWPRFFASARLAPQLALAGS